jgi:predicted secreted Zn-dependent protease
VGTRHPDKKQQLLIKSLNTELDEDAEFDEDEDDPQLRRIRRECETRVKEYEERMQQLQFDMRRQL